MFHRIALTFFLICISFLTAFAGNPRDYTNERRTALVVGNNNYLFSKLKNPVHDAKDMATALQKLGFQVDLQLNTDRKSFRRAIRDFGKHLKQGGVGLFYFAGHGMQLDGENFLIPVDADIQSEDEIPDYGISANTVLRKMEAAGNPFNMVFLDACRDNPFARSFRSSQSGMARMDAPSGSLIVYATAIGRKARDGDGRNGAFTASLLKYLPQRNLEVGMLLRRVRADVMDVTNGQQVPWSSSSLTGDFYFQKGPTSIDKIRDGRRPLSQADASPHKSNQQTVFQEQQNYPVATFREIHVKKISSGCPSAVSIGKDSFRLGSGWCFYKIETFVESNDYTVEFDARLEGGSGYGIWFRGSWRNNKPSALGIQYDPGARGLLLVKYPGTDSAIFARKGFTCDNGWHHWKLVGEDASVKVYLDDHLVFDRNNSPAQGTEFGFRTWRGKVHVKNIVLSVI